MMQYRAYVLSADDHIDRAVEMVCPDDDIAKRHAKNLADVQDVELWQQDRKIAKFKRLREKRL
jgi:hypothetical protein